MHMLPHELLIHICSGCKASPLHWLEGVDGTSAEGTQWTGQASRAHLVRALQAHLQQEVHTYDCSQTM